MYKKDMTLNYLKIIFVISCVKYVYVAQHEVKIIFKVFIALFSLVFESYYDSQIIALQAMYHIMCLF